MSINNTLLIREVSTQNEIFTQFHIFCDKFTSPLRGYALKWETGPTLLGKVLHGALAVNVASFCIILKLCIIQWRIYSSFLADVLICRKAVYEG